MGTRAAGAASLILLLLMMIGVTDSEHVRGRSFCGVKSSDARSHDTGFHRSLPPDDGKPLDALYVPIAVFYDDLMYKKVGSNETELYRFIRAIMTTTQAIYDSDVIARIAKITLHVVEIKQANYSELDNDGNAYDYLTGLGRWTNTLPDKGKWQFAVLLTGANTRSRTADNRNPQNLLELTGLANVGYVCNSGKNRHEATAVVEGRNFNSAFVLAHELGHSFNVNHDGDGDKWARECSPDHHIMSPSTGKGKLEFSKCSGQALRDHLRELKEKGTNTCLDPVPAENIITGFENLRRTYAGQVYNATEQCRFSLGPAYDADFTAVSSICPMMYCIHNFWQVRSHPALPGTACGGGGNRRCNQSGKCVAFN